MPRPNQRDQLLALATDYYQRTGDVHISLRALAPKLGTSHRMLLHYFGTKAQLLTAVWDEAGRQFYAQFLPPGEINPLAVFAAYRDYLVSRLDGRASGAQLIAPQLIALAMSDPDEYGALARDSLEAAREFAESIFERSGLPVPDGLPTYCVAVVRGLEFELLITHDLETFNSEYDLLLDTVKTLIANSRPARLRRRGARAS